MGRDERGNTAVIFGLALIPLMGVAGFAIDYNAAYNQKGLLQNALDAATLSGAQSLIANPSAVPNLVTNSVSAALSGRTVNAPTVLVSTSANSVQATATLVVPNTFMGIVGVRTSTLNAVSQATYGTNGKLEVAIVFDTTYSMNGAKLAAAQSAANTLVNTIFTIPNATNLVKAALVPFDYYVNVGTTYSGATWLTSTAPVTTPVTNVTTTCTTPATYSSSLTSATCTSDGVPYDCSYYAQVTPASGCTSTSVNTTSTATWNGCVGSRSYPLDMTDTVALTDPVPALIGYGCANALQRLTNSSSTLISQINSLVANNETYIAPGLLWGWRVLSPNAPFADGAAYGAANKSIVLMTDGFNTHSPNYPDHEGTNTTLANQLTAQTCTAIKAQGINIYAIAFEVTDPTIKGILQNCATAVSYYYDATTITALTAAFQTIGAQLTALRLSK